MSQVDLLLEAGIDPEDDLAFYTIPTGSFKHEKVVYSVLFGKYDAGAVPLHDFERMVDAGKIERGDFRVLAKGQPIPYCTFGVTQRIDDAFAEDVQEVLMGIDEDTTVEIDGEVLKVLDNALIDGYEPADDEDFNVVRDMAKRTNMPPYQSY